MLPSTNHFLMETYPANATHREVLLSASTLRQYLFCNYVPYIRFVKFNKGIKVRTVLTSEIRNAGSEPVRVERGGVTEEMTFLDVFERSLNESEVSTIDKLKLRTEVIPGIMLIGAIDKLRVLKGRVALTERKFVNREKPFDGEIAQIIAYALLLNKNFGIKFEDMDCSIEFLDRESKALLKRFPVKIGGEQVKLLKKCLWELGEIAVRAKVPEPTSNPKKCAKCHLSSECDKSISNHIVT